MIGKLKGVVDEVDADHLILDVQGVGYHVSCSANTLGALPARGEAMALLIETYVREDAIRLFGFAGAAERDWFRLLTTVQGVGTKVALAILSVLKPAELASAIALQDKAQVVRAPGVGPKMAQRIVTELKDKAPAFTAASDPALAALQSVIGAGRAPQPVADAVSALVNLGYGQAQASQAISKALKDLGEEAETAALIRVGLKALSA